MHYVMYAKLNKTNYMLNVYRELRLKKVLYKIKSLQAYKNLKIMNYEGGLKIQYLHT